MGIKRLAEKRLFMAAVLAAVLVLAVVFAGVGKTGLTALNVYAGQTDMVGNLQIRFLDVGQGDAALITCKGEAMLIDGGGGDSSSLIYSILKDQGISYLEYVVATHPDEDHIGGLAGAFNAAAAGMLISSTCESDSEAFNNILKYKGDAELVVPEAGDRFYLGDAECTVLGPVSAGSDINNESIVLKITYGDTSFLFMGDAGEEEELSILRSGADVSADLIKISHHGSSSSTSDSFLNAADPSYAVISSGAYNDYGHPSDDVLGRLQNHGVFLYRTDMQGSIICRSSGSSIAIFTERNELADTYQTYYDLYIKDQASAAGADQSSQVISAAGEDQNGPAQAQNDEITRLFILNTRSKKIHSESCSSAASMSAKNRLEAEGTLESIMSEYPDYTLCGNCHGQ